MPRSGKRGDLKFLNIKPVLPAFPIPETEGLAVELIYKKEQHNENNDQKRPDL